MNRSKGNKMVSDFIKLTSEKSGLKIKSSEISRNIVELTGEINFLLYVKARSDYPLRWGITANIIDKLRKQNNSWAVILLFLVPNKGYLLSSNDVEYYIKNVWPIGKDGDYKIAEGSYLANNSPLHTINEFLKQLYDIAEHSSTIQMNLTKAAEQAQKLRTNRESESQEHKSLKEYIAGHPEVICLDKADLAIIECTFPSGDRVDILFKSQNNNWTAVEIEIEGIIQNLIGLFQAVKYRALQEAVLHVQNMTGKVESMLVAKSIPEQIKKLANRLRIKTHEIDTQN